MAKHWTAKARRWWFAQKMKGKKGKGGGSNAGDQINLREVFGKKPPKLPEHVQKNLDEAAAAIGSVGVTAQINGRYFKDAPHAVAEYDGSGKKVIRLNPEHGFWHDPAGVARDFHATGYLSSAHPMHVVHHEMGHAEHHRHLGDEGYASIPQKWTPATQHLRPVAAKVSGRATENPREFVAEVYAARRAGQQHSEDIVHGYNELGGPP